MVYAEDTQKETDDDNAHESNEEEWSVSSDKI